MVAIVLAVGAGGCESTQEKSAKLEREAKRATHAQQGLSIVKQSTVAKVLSAGIVHGSEGAAAVVTVRNESSRALRAVPIAIAVKSANGETLFENNAPGLEAALISIGSLAPHATVTWVDDQVPANGSPASVSAELGEASTLNGGPATISVSGLHEVQEPTGGTAVGTVANRSHVAQTNLVVYVVGRRGGKLVAAGRAVLPSLAAGASSSFQAFLVGQARGAQLQALAPATSF